MRVRRVDMELSSKSRLSTSQPKMRQQQRIKISSLRLGTKGTLALVFAIVIILITSVFIVLQSAPSNDNIFSPTASPSPILQQTPGTTSRPTASGAPNAPNPTASSMPHNEEKEHKEKGRIELAQVMNSSVWMGVGQEAWAYFKPDVGVDPTTGLPGAVSGFPYFTDWDLGVYIQAVLDAQQMGLVSKDGDWGADFRFAKILDFLDTRPLNETTHYPFWFYRSGNGENYAEQSDLSTVTVDVVDAGRLFVALNNLKSYKPGSDWSIISNSSKTIAQRIDDIVYNGQNHGRSNYAALVPEIKVEAGSSSIYAYYYTKGFAAFWPNELGSVPGKILDNLLRCPIVTVNENGNVTLPNALISCEPLLHSVFELNISDSLERSKLLNFTRQVYLAHEERLSLYNANLTKIPYVAFSEGNSGTPTFIYEWVILPGKGSWKVTTIDMQPYDINPIIYSKVALGFLALYNTTYAKDMCVYIESAMPLASKMNGWCDGTDYTMLLKDRKIINTVGSNTNGMILEAANYFIQNNPND